MTEERKDKLTFGEIIKKVLNVLKNSDFEVKLNSHDKEKQTIINIRSENSASKKIENDKPAQLEGNRKNDIQSS